MRQKKLLKWEFRERENNPKLGTMSTNEKLGIKSFIRRYSNKWENLFRTSGKKPW